MQTPNLNPVATHSSKVDAWLAAIIAIAIGVSLFAPVNAALSGNKEALWTSLLGFILPALLIACFSPIRYVIDSDSVIVRAGLLRSTIAIREVADVSPTRNPLSAPAWSLDRLAIRDRHGELRALISPKDKAKFIADLASRDDALLMIGDRLVRREGPQP